MFNNKCFSNLLGVCSVLPALVIMPAVADDILWGDIKSELENGNSLVLTNDVTADAVIDVTGSPTLDLADKTITGWAGQGLHVGNAGATFTIKGTNAESAVLSGFAYTSQGGLLQSGQNTTINIDNISMNDNGVEGTTTDDYHLGGALKISGIANVTNSIFQGNTARGIVGNSDYEGSAGAIYASKFSKISIKNTKFLQNEADAIGAVGIFKEASLEDVDFEKNKATSATGDGGGALFFGSVSDATVNSVSNSSFKENESASRGGAISTRAFAQGNNSAAKLDITNAVFDSNIAATNGGAIDNYFYHSSTNADGVTIDNSTFTANQANKGGAIYNHIGIDTEVLLDGEKQVGSMYITNSVFGALDNSGNPIADKGNTALSIGGAIYNEGKMVVKDSAFYANNSVNVGGAFYTSGDLTIDNTDFIENKASGTSKNGGTIYATAAANNLNITNSTFKTNATFGGAGGAIWSAAKNLTITDSIFDQNSNRNISTNATNDGSAIYVNAGDKFVLLDNKFNGNTGKTTVHSKALATDIKNTEFINNNNTSNGALSAVAASDNSLVTVDNSSFTGNKSTGSGGAAFYTNMAKTGNRAIVKNSTFTNNEMTADKGNGGAILVGSSKTNLELINNVFTENKALAGVSEKTSQGQGGAVKGVGTLTVDQNTFLQNEATYGGALYVAGAVTVTGSSFDGNKAKIRATVTTDETGLGGAIAQEGSTLNVLGSTFTKNEAETSGGAIFQCLMGDGIANLTVDKSTFANNTARAGGALFLLEQANITNSDFIGNTSTGTTNGDAGGAIFLGAESQTTITDDLFTSNTSASDGGAISTRAFAQGNNSAAKLDITNAVFDSNIAATNGGAIDNYFYHSSTNADGVTIDNSTFTANQANKGGAIYNHIGIDTEVLLDGEKQVGSIYISNSSFMDNIATEKGGAIYNEGNMTLTGNNVFSNNKTNNGLNDIYNIGMLNVSGDLTLDGGIIGDGTIIFAEDSVLNVDLFNGVILQASAITLGNNVMLELDTIENGIEAKDYTFADVTDWTGDFVLKDTLTSNALYTISTAEGVLSITRKSVTDQTANLEKMGLDSNAAKTIAAISGVKTMGNADVDTLFADLTAAAQSGDADAIAQINEVTKAINPESESVVQSVAVSAQNIINNLTVERMDMGRNGGDVDLTSGGVWVQGLYNKSKNADKFSANTRGISAGIDGTINNDIMMGIGYAFGRSDITAQTRNTDIDSHSVFLYGQYKPSEWYANATLNYTMSKYNEEGVAVVPVNSEYRANAFGANVATGYDFESGITPELGLRYLHVSTNAYTNSLGMNVESNSTDFLTGIVGARYGFDIMAGNAFLIRPELSAAAKYDLLSDKNFATVALPGVDAYTLDGERLNRFGGEFGVGLAMSYYGFDLLLSYSVDVRKDYTSQTGMAKFRYNF